MVTSSSSYTTGKADLHDRTAAFARKARSFVSKTPRTIASLGDCRRLIYASGAVGAHYIAADEAGSRESFLRSIHDCRRNAKESAHWLQLLAGNLEEHSEKIRGELEKEARELDRVFGAIIGKVLNKAKSTKAAQTASAVA